MLSGSKSHTTSTWTDVRDPKVGSHSQAFQKRAGTLFVQQHAHPPCPQLSRPAVYPSSRYSARTLPIMSTPTTYPPRTPPLNLRSFRFSTQLDPPPLPRNTKSSDILSSKRSNKVVTSSNNGDIGHREQRVVKGKTSGDSAGSSSGYGEYSRFLAPVLMLTRVARR
jgi:hypothetical protein